MLLGSSPRMRGTQLRRHRKRRHRGLIPTYAGNTAVPVLIQNNTGAHPHVCGEHATIEIWTAITQGSSPRMRGTPSTPATGHDTAGLIPTYAGNTVSKTHTPTRGGAHPHVCGEHACHSWLLRLLLGSSPRMRGTLLLTVLRVSSSGLIPTYAGNTAVARHLTPLAGAHPHVCGEHTC